MGKSRSGFEDFNLRNSKGLASGTTKMAIHYGEDNGEEGKMQLLIFEDQIWCRASLREIRVLSKKEKTCKKESKNLYKHQNNKRIGGGKGVPSSSTSKGDGFFRSQGERTELFSFFVIKIRFLTSFDILMPGLKNKIQLGLYLCDFFFVFYSLICNFNNKVINDLI